MPIGPRTPAERERARKISAAFMGKKLEPKEPGFKREVIEAAKKRDKAKRS